MSSSTPAPFEPSCANCRHHTSKMVPKLREDTESSIDGSYFVADDSDVPVYSCTVLRTAANKEAAPYAEREVGQVPVNCPSWQAPIAGPAKAARDAEVDARVAAWEARQAARATRGDRDRG